MIVDQYKFGSGSFPPVIEDGNTVGWYLSDDLTTITKDGSDLVSVWADKLGSGHDLLQATPANQPLWVENDGILFDGDDDVLYNSFTFAQPEFIYIIFKQVTWVSPRWIFNGYNSASGLLRQINTTPRLEVYAGGGFSTQDASLSVGTYGIVRVLFNGANSSFQINEGTKHTGNYGTSIMGGFSLGNSRGGGAASNIQVKEIILRNIADAAQDEKDIYDYLAEKTV